MLYDCVCALAAGTAESRMKDSVNCAGAVLAAGFCTIRYSPFQEPGRYTRLALLPVLSQSNMRSRQERLAHAPAGSHFLEISTEKTAVAKTQADEAFLSGARLP